MAKNKVINTVLQLRDNMSGGLLKAAKNAKKSGAQISDDMMKATRQVVAFKNKLKSTAVSAAKNFAKIGAASAGAVAALAAKTGFSEALDLEGYRLQLETATKDTQKAGKIMRYAIDLANKTPFEGGALVEGAAKFEAMGMSATQWLSRAGDMAAATNKDFDQAVEALIDAQAGELERLKEFGITKAKMLEKGEKLFAGVQLVNNKGQIVNQEKFNEAMLALMQDRFAGGMAKQAGTMKGLWSTVTGVTKSALAKIVGITEDGSIQSGSALDLLKGKVQGLAEKLAEWQQDGTITRIADKFTAGVIAIQTAAEHAFGWMQENVAPVARALADAAAEAFEWAKENVLPHAEVLLKKVAGAFEWIAQNMDKVAPVLKGLIKLWVGSKILKFGADAVSAGNDMWNFGKTVFRVAGTNLPKAGALFKSGFGKALDGGLKAADLLGTGIVKVGGLFGKVIGKVGGVGKALLGLAAAHPVIAGIIAAAGFIILNWEKIKPVLQALLEKAKEVFGAIRDWAVEKFNAVKDTITGVYTTVRNTFTRVKDTIIGAFDSAKQRIAGFFSWIDDKIESIPLLGQIYKGNKKVVRGVVDWVGDRLGGNALGTSYWKGGPTWVNERGGEIMNLPNGTQIIPHDVSLRAARGPQVTVNVTVQGNVIGNRQYADEMGNIIVRRILAAVENM